MKTWTTPT